MKKLVLVLLCAVILALFVWLRRSEDAVAATEARAPEVETLLARPTAAAALQASEPVAEPASAAREVAREAERPEPAPSEPPSAPAPRPPAPDLSAREWIHLVVQNRFGAPIANAEIEMTGLRSQRDRGSHWAWYDDPEVVRTAADGTAKLWHPVWIDPDNPTGEVTLVIRHPDYITHEENAFAIGTQARVVVLEQGSVLVVSGWIDSQGEVIRDVVPHLTYSAQVPKDAWLPIKDGRLSCASIPPGERHGIYLSHTSAALGACFSEAVFFEIGEGEQEELHLQLVPGRRFEGRLDDVVPRPVQNGAVTLNLQIDGGWDSMAAMVRTFTTDVHPDGTFAFDGLPPGSGQMIGICDGWVSCRATRADLPDADPEAELTEVQEAELREASLVLQSVDPGTGEPYVLEMEPSSSVSVQFVGPRGEPVEGVLFSLWPNVHWGDRFGGLFMEREYSARSDGQGRATITNLPSGRMSGGVAHAHLELPVSEHGRRSIQVTTESGKTLELRLELAERGGG